MKNKNVPFENRPTCACGVKMKLTQYKGYYETFSYWVCDNCELDDDIQDMTPDSTYSGSYA